MIETKSYLKIETLFKRDKDFNLTTEIRCPEFENIKKWLITEKINGTNIRVIFNKDGISIKGRTDNAQTPGFLLQAISDMFHVEKFITTFEGAEASENKVNREYKTGAGDMADDITATRIENEMDADIAVLKDEVNRDDAPFLDEESAAAAKETKKTPLGTYLHKEEPELITKEAREVCLYGEGYGQKIQKGGGNYNKGNSFRLFDVWVNGWWLEWEDVEKVASELGIKTVPVIMETDLETAIELGKVLLSGVALEEGIYGTIAEGIVARPHPLMLFRNGTPIKWKLKAKDFIRKEVVE